MNIEEAGFDEKLRNMKLDIIEGMGRIDFTEANIRIMLAELRLRKVELKRLAGRVKRLETAHDIFVSGNNEKEK